MLVCVPDAYYNIIPFVYDISLMLPRRAAYINIIQSMCVCMRPPPPPLKENIMRSNVNSRQRYVYLLKRYRENGAGGRVSEYYYIVYILHVLYQYSNFVYYQYNILTVTTTQLHIFYVKYDRNVKQDYYAITASAYALNMLFAKYTYVFMYIVYYIQIFGVAGVGLQFNKMTAGAQSSSSSSIRSLYRNYSHVKFIDFGEAHF